MTTLTITSHFPLIQRLSNGEKLQESLRAVYEKHPVDNSHLITRIALQTLNAIISILGEIPFIPVSMPLGKVLGPICVAGNTLTFLVVNYWAAKGVINPVFGPKTEAEIELNKDSGDTITCKKVALISAASLIALLSQLPNALAAMNYNEKKYKVAAGLVLLLSGAILPLRSVQLSLEKIVLKEESRELKEKMGNLIAACHEAFIKKSLREKAVFIQSLPIDTDAHTLALIQLEPPVTTGLLNYVGLGLGAILTGIAQYAFADYTFVTTKQQVWDNDIAAGVCAALTVASTVYLVGLSIIKTTQRIFNVCGNAIAGNETRNLSWQLRPKLSAALTAIALLINTTALGPSWVIWGDFYTKKVEHELFQKGVCIALFMLFFTSSLDIIDEVVVASLANGTEEEKSILQASEEFKKLEALIRGCPNDEFVAYLNRDGSAPEAFRSKLGIIADHSQSI